MSLLSRRASYELTEGSAEEGFDPGNGRVSDESRRAPGNGTLLPGIAGAEGRRRDPGLVENFDKVHDSLVKAEAEVRGSSDRVVHYNIPFPGWPTQEFQLFFQNKNLDDLLSAVTWNG